VFGILADRCERNLVRAEGAFDRNPVDFFRARPALGRAQDDHRPDRLLLEAIRARVVLNRSDLGITIVERCRKELMHDERIVAFDEIGLVAAAA
jgi:hypothetical protein